MVMSDICVDWQILIHSACLHFERFITCHYTVLVITMYFVYLSLISPCGE